MADVCEDCGRPLAPDDFDELEAFPFPYGERCNRLHDDYYCSGLADCHSTAYQVTKAKLAAAEQRAEAAKKKLADVEALDAWGDKYTVVDIRLSRIRTFVALRSSIGFMEELFEGPTPAEARAKAAQWIREQRKGDGGEG